MAAIKDIWGFDAINKLIKKQGNVQAVLQMDLAKFEEKIFNRIYDKDIDSMK